MFHSFLDRTLVTTPQASVAPDVPDVDTSQMAYEVPPVAPTLAPTSTAPPERKEEEPLSVPKGKGKHTEKEEEMKE